MASALRVLQIAASQIGYSRWNDPEEGTRYGRWYAQRTGVAYFGVNGVPFCAMGVSWVFDQAGMGVPGLPGAYCPTIESTMRSAGLEVDKRSTAPGDVLLFDWDADGESDHIGFAEVNCGGYVQTIEFNTNNGSVARRARDWSTVRACFRPRYDGSGSVTQSFGLEVDGIWGRATTLAYQNLRNCPFKDGVISRQNADWRGRCPGLGTGWEWVPGGEEPGSQTISDFQRLVGASVDGLIGPDTINRAIVFFSRLSGADLQDGRIDCPSITVRAFQRWINNGGRF